MGRKLKKTSDLDISAACSDEGKTIDNDRRVFSLDFKLAKDSMLEEIMKSFKIYSHN